MKLKPISDPEKVEVQGKDMKPLMKLRSLETLEKVRAPNGKYEQKKVKAFAGAISASNGQKLKQIQREIDCQQIADRVLDSAIEQKSNRKLYYIGKGDKKLFCGPVIQVIPIGTYAAIGSGKSIYSPKSPFDGKALKFEKDRQILFRVGRNVAKDFVIVIAANGCVLLESSAMAVLNMPVYVVEPTGQYYYINHGQRVLNLGPGSHLVVYTKESPILFVTVQKTEQVLDQKKGLELFTKSEDKKKNKSPEKETKPKSEPKLPESKPEPKPEEPKPEEPKFEPKLPESKPKPEEPKSEPKLPEIKLELKPEEPKSEPKSEEIEVVVKKEELRAETKPESLKSEEMWTEAPTEEALAAPAEVTPAAPAEVTPAAPAEVAPAAPVEEAPAAPVAANQADQGVAVGNPMASKLCLTLLIILALVTTVGLLYYSNS